MDRIRCSVCIVIACAATSGCGLILGGNDMAWLDSPKIDPELREWILENPDGRVEIMAWFTLPEPIGKRQELTREEKEDYRVAHEAYIRKLSARHQGADVSQDELAADLEHVARLAQPLKEKREAFQRVWYARRTDVIRRAREAGMRRLRGIPELEYLGPPGELGHHIGLNVTVRQIARLVALDEIGRIHRNVHHTGALGVSHRAAAADVVHNMGIQGVGQRIASLDTGIHRGTLLQGLQHPAIHGIGAGLHGNFTTKRGQPTSIPDCAARELRRSVTWTASDARRA